MLTGAEKGMIALADSLTDPLAYADAHFGSLFKSDDNSSSVKRIAELEMLVAEKVVRAHPAPTLTPFPLPVQKPRVMQDSQMLHLRHLLQASQEKELELQVRSTPRRSGWFDSRAFAWRDAIVLVAASDHRPGRVLANHHERAQSRAHLVRRRVELHIE
jgi:hypothetical protein